jgi:hypothetical protein
MTEATKTTDTIPRIHLERNDGLACGLESLMDKPPVRTGNEVWVTCGLCRRTLYHDRIEEARRPT